MPAIFRLGLVGAGRMGRTHLRALARPGPVAISAVAEPSARIREGLEGTGVQLYAGVAQMLDRPALDGVLIAAPSDQHRSIIGEIAAAGLPILCEKPCGVSPEVARFAGEIAASAGVPLQVAYWRRFVPPLRELRDRVHGGDLGAVHLVTCYQWDRKPPPVQFRAHSGGIAIDMGVHEFDQLRWLTGQDIGRISAMASPLVQDPDVTGDADSAQMLVEMSGGAVGFVSLGRHHPAGDIARTEVFGTAATAQCRFLDPTDGELAQLEALRLQAEAFGMAAAGADCGGATAADAVAALTAAQRAAEAIHSPLVTGL
jgi:myo-inositol 2-dehydrogenase / D-chiro-inositol 1-dehydrogenase